MSGYDGLSEQQEMVERALAAGDSGNAGHWPTVAGILTGEVRRLRDQRQHLLGRIAVAAHDFDTAFRRHDPNSPWQTGQAQGHADAAAMLQSLLDREANR